MQDDFPGAYRLAYHILPVRQGKQAAAILFEPQYLFGLCSP